MAETRTGYEACHPSSLLLLRVHGWSKTGRWRRPNNGIPEHKNHGRGGCPSDAHRDDTLTPHLFRCSLLLRLCPFVFLSVLHSLWLSFVQSAGHRLVLIFLSP